MTYVALFFSAFVAATLIPAQSEAVLAWHITNAPEMVVVFVMVASLGNILGAVVNWGIGLWMAKGLNHPRLIKWFGASPQKTAKAAQFYHRYGRWSLLASWVPFIGDPITIVAGVFREPLPSFLLIVSIAKTSRYVVIAAITLGLF